MGPYPKHALEKFHDPIKPRLPFPAETTALSLTQIKHWKSGTSCMRMRLISPASGETRILSVVFCVLWTSLQHYVILADDRSSVTEQIVCTLAFT